jgi:hypothetical protein
MTASVYSKTNVLWWVLLLYCGTNIHAIRSNSSLKTKLDHLSPCVLSITTTSIVPEHSDRNDAMSNNEHFVHDLVSNEFCQSSGVWFHDSITPKSIQIIEPLEDYYEGTQESNHKEHTIPMAGQLQCNGIECLPPFWAWWDEVSVHCVLEPLGGQALKRVEFTPWNSKGKFNERDKFIMEVDNTYLQLDNDTRKFMWHCRSFPRVYSAVSIECPAKSKLLQTLDTIATNETVDDNFETTYVQNLQLCSLHIKVSMGVNILIYGFSAVIIVTACVCYLCFMWACLSWCKLNPWRKSRNDISKKHDTQAPNMRQRTIMYPNHGGSFVQYGQRQRTNMLDKSSSFGNMFARLARFGGFLPRKGTQHVV